MLAENAVWQGTEGTANSVPQSARKTKTELKSITDDKRTIPPTHRVSDNKFKCVWTAEYEVNAKNLGDQSEYDKQSSNTGFELGKNPGA